jgi:Tol biopolymer transport system component
MHRGRGRRVLVFAVLAALLTLPAPASAVLSGENGRIVFVSGRDNPTAGDDSTAELFLRPVPFSTGGGTAAPVPTATGANQHRHPTWSPDRTMIAYAHGDNFCRADATPTESTNCALYILDLTDPNATPQPITAADNIADDRPAWSPDGTRIAYETELADNSSQRDIVIDQQPFGSPDINLTNTSGAYEGKPAWSPNSQTLYYEDGNRDVAPSMGVDVNIVAEPADNSGAPALAVPDGGVHEFQPSISPDGDQICYTLGTGFNSTASILIHDAGPPPDPNPPIILASSGAGDYNCTWSPDGTLIAYVTGTFTSGQLVMERADNTSPFPLDLETTASHFDGNPDWAPDGRPACEDETVNTTVNTPVSIQVTCPDTGPQYEQTEVRGVVATEPSNGTTSPNDQDPAFTFPTNVTYTPNQGFTGTDTFTTQGFDEFGFGDREGTITIEVVRFGRTITFDATKGKKTKKAGKDPLLAVKKGKKATFSGDVSAPGATNVCEANQTVELQRKKSGQADFTTFAQLQTDGAGNFSVKQKIKKTFEWRGVLTQSAQCVAANSNSERVKAKKKKK